MRAVAAALAVITILGVSLASAQSVPIRYSTDVAVVLDGQAVTHASVVEDLASHPILAEGSLGLPAPIDLVGFDLADDGSWLFAVGTEVNIGGTLISPADVASFNGSAYSLAFDGQAASVPAGAGVDAVISTETGIYLSFDVDVDLSTIIACDEDLVYYQDGIFSMILDLSTKDLTNGLDLNAADKMDDGIFLLSFDGHGEIGGVLFTDEDVVAFDPVGETFSLAYDGSANRSGWTPAGIDALSGLTTLLFEDGFESGDMSAWSLAIP